MTVQKICRVCKDEKDVKLFLDAIWKEPSKARKFLSETTGRNQKIFEFEKIIASCKELY